MLPARRVGKSMPWNGRAGWVQLCGNAMAHYYEHGQNIPICGASISYQCHPERGVPVPACKMCVKARGGRL
jgi:hypothetical protein